MCAVVALQLDLGVLQRYQHGDSLLPVLISLQRWTPFYWEQDRIGMLLPLVAMPVKHPLANLLFQDAIAIFCGLMAIGLIARYACNDSTWCAVAAITTGVFLMFAPGSYRFEYLVNQPYGPSLTLAVTGLLLLENAEHWSWLRWTAALASILGAHWVNAGVGILLAPLVVLRMLMNQLGGETRRRYVLHSLALLALGILLGYTSHRFARYQQTDLGIMAAAEWPASWWALLESALSILMPSRWVFYLQMSVALGALLLLVPGMRARSGASLAAASVLASAAVVSWLTVGTFQWAKINGFPYRYTMPSAMLFALACTALAFGPVCTMLGSRGQRTVNVGALVMLVVAAGASSGVPSAAAVRADLETRFRRLTDDVVAARCTHVLGDYWAVWPTVFLANLRLHELGAKRVVWGISHRSGPTRRLWKRVPLQEMRVAVPLDDPMADFYARMYRVPPLVPVEQRSTLVVLRPRAVSESTAAR